MDINLDVDYKRDLKASGRLFVPEVATLAAATAAGMAAKNIFFCVADGKYYITKVDGSFKEFGVDGGGGFNLAANYTWTGGHAFNSQISTSTVIGASSNAVTISPTFTVNQIAQKVYGVAIETPVLVNPSAFPIGQNIALLVGALSAVINDLGNVPGIKSYLTGTTYFTNSGGFGIAISGNKIYANIGYGANNPSLLFSQNLTTFTSSVLIQKDLKLTGAFAIGGMKLKINSVIKNDDGDDLGFTFIAGITESFINPSINLLGYSAVSPDAGFLGFNCNINSRFAFKVGGVEKYTISNKGVSPIKVTSAQLAAIAVTSADEGLEVYDLTLHKKCFYNGSAWEAINSTVI